MESYRMRYVSVAHSAAASDAIAFTLERDDGGQFVVMLSADEGRRLADDLAEQVRIATS